MAQNRSKLALLGIFLVLSVSLPSCARRTVLRPITAKDFYLNGKDYCFNPEYMKDILKVQIEARGR